jgi:hypothetical protein
LPAPAGGTRLTATVFNRSASRMQQAFVVADVSASCAHPPRELTLRYLQGGGPPRPEHDFSTTLALPRVERGTTRAFFAAYASGAAQGEPTQFAGVEVAAGAEGCVRLSRVRGLDDALWLDATLAPGWRDRPLYERLYLGPLFPERLWLRIAKWWPSFAALG